jgi:Ca2+-binding RTX toxin-like protein
MTLQPGTEGNDILNGTPDNDTIHGFGGNDVLFGNDGNDLITGDLGNDVLHSGNGDDDLSGGPGRDTLIFTGTGTNVANGNGGDDLLRVDLSDRGPEAAIRVAKYNSGRFDVSLTDNSFSVASYNMERFHIIGGAGEDWIGGGDNNDILVGNGGDDGLGGGLGNDLMRGGAGHDFIEDLTGEDRILGGGGNDTLGIGHDTTSTTSGDYVDGGKGFDTLRLQFTGDADTEFTLRSGAKSTFDTGLVVRRVETFDVTSGAGDDDFTLIARATGFYRWNAGDGEDHITLDLSQMRGNAAYREHTSGGYGSWEVGAKTATLQLNDVESLTIIGNDLANSFAGGRGRDTFKGGGGNDELIGGGNADRLLGEAGNDSLFGGKGADILRGGIGDDYLEGGNGPDRFVFAMGDGTDRIADFIAGSDLMVFSGTGLSYDDLSIRQKSGFVRVALGEDGADDQIVIRVLGATIDQIDDSANFLF